MQNDTHTHARTGHGGSYRVYPETGQRVLIERTGHTEPQPDEPPQGDDADVATDS